MLSRRFATFTIITLLALALPAVADSRIEREFELGQGGDLIVDAANGSVVVTGTSGSLARVVITSRRDDLESHYDLDFEHASGRLEITVERKGSKIGRWFNWSNGSGLKFEIEVPTSTTIDIDTAGGSIYAESIDGRSRLDTSGGSITARRMGAAVEADTSGGSIDIEDVSGNVIADTSGGSISVENVRGDLRADTSGGSIRIDDVTGDITADTSGGGIRISEAGGHVYADTSGGTVTVGFAPGNGRGGELSTSGGGIRVTLDPSTGLDLDAVASGGSVIADIPVTVKGRISKSALRGKIGGGGESLTLRASGGTIRIESN